MPTYHNITQFQKYLIEYAPDSSIEKEQFFEVFNANSSIQSFITLSSIVYLVLSFVSVVFGIKHASALIKAKFKDDADEDEKDKEEK